MVKKIAASVLLCLWMTASCCFASAWQFAGSDNGSHEHYYLLDDTIWFDGTIGGAGMKIQYADGSYDLCDFQFLDRKNSVYRVSFKNPSAYTRDGMFRHYIDNDCHFMTGREAPLARVCRFAIQWTKLKGGDLE